MPGGLLVDVEMTSAVLYDRRDEGLPAVARGIVDELGWDEVKS